MPAYDHLCKSCNHEWSDFYSIHAAAPTVCPSCNVDGQVMRLISKPGNVKVELQGRELIQQLWKEGKDLAKKARTNENIAADIYGRK